MNRRAAVSAPGKLILMGEHAAVYGRPALVAALGLRTTVTIEALSGPGIALDLETLGLREKTDWDSLEEYRRTCAERWRSFDEDPSPERFAALADRDPARVVRLAIAESVRVLGSPPAAGIGVRVVSRLPVGSGFGSSASVAVSVAAAVLALAGRLAAGAERSRRDELAAIALEVERRQHGRPSGVDHTTVLRGGILRIDPAAGSVEPLVADSRRLSSLRVFDTGAPAEGTGEVVAAVRARRRESPERFDAILAAMEDATANFAAALAPGGDSSGMLAAMSAFERRLEEIGVVPPAVLRAVEAVERCGGAAKLSGAGSLAGPGAGALLVCWPSATRGGGGEGVPALPRHRARIGAPGLRVEEQE